MTTSSIRLPRTKTRTAKRMMTTTAIRPTVGLSARGTEQNTFFITITANILYLFSQEYQPFHPPSSPPDRRRSVPETLKEHNSFSSKKADKPKGMSHGNWPRRFVRIFSFLYILGYMGAPTLWKGKDTGDCRMRRCCNSSTGRNVKGFK